MSYVKPWFLPPPPGVSCGPLLLHEFIVVQRTFWRISAKTHELLASILCCWRPKCAVSVHIVLLASILCCWRLYCAVGIPADASTVVGQSLLFLASCTNLPSAVDAVMFPVLRIRDVYPGSWFYPSRISDPKQLLCSSRNFPLLWAVLNLLKKRSRP